MVCGSLYCIELAYEMGSSYVEQVNYESLGPKNDDRDTVDLCGMTRAVQNAQCLALLDSFHSPQTLS